MKIWDLNDLSITKNFTDNLQTNLKIAKRLFGERFHIADANIKMPALLYLLVEPHNKKLKYYNLIYDIKERNNWEFPFKIEFLDRETLELNNNCYIANIHKTEEITGTQIVTTILKLLKLLKVEYITLHDGTRIDCGKREIDLSFFKLIEKGITFYQKFGFRFTISEHSIHERMNFGKTENMDQILFSYLKKFRKIKLKYYINAYNEILEILFEVLKNQDYENIKIYLYHPKRPFLIKKEETRSKVLALINEIDTTLRILVKSQRTYLYEILIDLFYKKCDDYLNIMSLILENNTFIITYKKKNVKLKNIDIINTLFFIRNASMFQLKLN